MSDEEQRGIERRVFVLEQKIAEMQTTVAVTETKVDGLAETIKSRFIAFDRGIDLILVRLTAIENLKNKAAGAVLFVQILGGMAIIAGVVALVRMVKG